MGGTKNRWMAQQEHGYSTSASAFVCTECVEDDALAAFIADRAEAESCDFCKRTADAPIAAHTDTVLDHIGESLQKEWEAPEDSLIRDSESPSGYFGPTIYGADDVFEAEGWPFANQAFADFVLDAFREGQYVSRNPYMLSVGDALSFGWREFGETVMHRTRFVFALLPEPGPDDGDDPDAAVRERAEMLAEIARLVREWNLVRVLDTDQDLVLVRVRDQGKEVDAATDLGAPPAQNASQSRMSPAGIPMFYGALELDTAIAETVDRKQDKGRVPCVGTFRLRTPLKVVDLGLLPDVPSIFDSRPQATGECAELGFLHSFRDDVSRRIERDDRIHVEYVPTQVLSEYLRRVFRDEDGWAVHGLMFESAQKPGGQNAVLFIDNEHCVERGDPDPWDGGPVLELIQVSQQPLAT